VNWDRVDYFYSGADQVVEERSATALADKVTVATVPKYQWVWDLRYLDAPVLRDENKDGDNDCIDGTDVRLYYAQDANFNTTALITTAGAVTERYAYNPYGAVSVFTSTWTSQASTVNNNEILFAGYRQDPETQLYHVRARMYHPTLGRFLERDPLGYHDGMNLYEYVGSDPYLKTDPTGKQQLNQNQQCKKKKKKRTTFVGGGGGGGGGGGNRGGGGLNLALAFLGGQQAAAAGGGGGGGGGGQPGTRFLAVIDTSEWSTSAEEARALLQASWVREDADRRYVFPPKKYGAGPSLNNQLPSWINEVDNFVGKNGSCLAELEIIGHGDDTHAAGGIFRPNVVQIGQALKNVATCSPCSIYLSSCYSGLWSGAQTLADNGPCIVYGAQGAITGYHFTRDAKTRASDNYPGSLNRVTEPGSWRRFEKGKDPVYGEDDQGIPF
jgi:RHS repeat-associated protein